MRYTFPEKEGQKTHHEGEGRTLAVKHVKREREERPNKKKSGRTFKESTEKENRPCISPVHPPRVRSTAVGTLRLVQKRREKGKDACPCIKKKKKRGGEKNIQD